MAKKTTTKKPRTKKPKLPKIVISDGNLNALISALAQMLRADAKEQTEISIKDAKGGHLSCAAESANRAMAYDDLADDFDFMSPSDLSVRLRKFVTIEEPKMISATATPAAKLAKTIASY